MTKLIHIFFITVFGLQAYANKTVRVCLNPIQNIGEVTIKIKEGSLSANGLKFTKATPINIVKHSNNFSVNGTKALKKLELISHNTHTIYTLQFSSTVKNVSSNNQYVGNLEVVHTSNGLKLFHIIELETYVAGVIEAEAGAGQNIEYYKVQAIICRTYALANINRHREEGYDLCNAVHCQVFKGISRHSNLITKAVHKTEGLLILDRNMRLANTSFHSNCGGLTVDAECVWSEPKHYLTEKVDPYCAGQSRSDWKRVIPKNTWLNYFSTVLKIDTLSELAIKKPLTRHDIYIDTIAFTSKDIRTHFNFPSALFSYQIVNDSVYVYGKGFGHGVGLCQEGAMQMSKLEKTYLEIIQHYYSDIHIIHIKDLDFYLEDEQNNAKSGFNME